MSVASDISLKFSKNVIWKFKNSIVIIPIKKHRHIEIREWVYRLHKLDGDEYWLVFSIKNILDWTVFHS